jgi:hypothetical protein
MSRTLKMLDVQNFEDVGCPELWTDVQNFEDVGCPEL